MKFLLILLTVLLIVLFFRLWVGQGSYSDIWHLQQQIEHKKQLISEQEEQNRQLKANVDDFKSGNEAIEEHARSELGMIKKGERYYQVILPEDELPSESPSSTLKTTPKQSVQKDNKTNNE